MENIEIENPGIDVKVAPGTAARCVYEGTVTMVMYMSKYQNVVLVRHGHYLTVYAGLGSVSVKKGQTVKAGQTIGTVAADSDNTGSGVLHFEVRNERQKLNPLDWVRQ
jgi:murein DD-endopeptidase MepM/ murein hydrolase activator NlpD